MVTHYCRAFSAKNPAITTRLDKKRDHHDLEHKLEFCTLKHGTSVRNRLAVRIAGSHPADRGSIPRYGSNHMVFSHNMADSEIPVPNYFFLIPSLGPFL
jgi:hypothetical protein